MSGGTDLARSLEWRGGEAASRTPPPAATPAPKKEDVMILAFPLALIGAAFLGIVTLAAR
jgi:hypothetical protein